MFQEMLTVISLLLLLVNSPLFQLTSCKPQRVVLYRDQAGRADMYSFIHLRTCKPSLFHTAYICGEAASYLYRCKFCSDAWSTTSMGFLLQEGTVMGSGPLEEERNEPGRIREESVEEGTLQSGLLRTREGIGGGDH